jgi:hypothetical protein
MPFGQRGSYGERCFCIQEPEEPPAALASLEEDKTPTCMFCSVDLTQSI